MTPARFIVLALALARPSAGFPDRYVDEAQATGLGPDRGAPIIDADRHKRAYGTWRDYELFSRWKPPTYQLSRPYFIPTYGASDRVAIYFPPQRLNINPGTPVDNPLPNRPFRGPGYLPPTTEEPTMDIHNRFNFDDDDDDKDRPIWDSSPSNAVAKEEEVIPTRPPRPPGANTPPPLVRDVSNGRGTNKLAVAEVQESAPSIRVTTTARAITIGPSNCVWAIVSCCSASSTVVPDRCFEQRGCPGPFWGSSPCDSDYAKAAIASALEYYGK